MKFLRKVFKGILIFIATLIVLTIVFAIYVYSISDAKPPMVTKSIYDDSVVVHSDSNLVLLGNNWLTKNNYGLYEMYIEGDAYERGLVYGKMAKPLLFEQELAFTNEIQRMIPSKSYLKFLKYVVGFMNRDLSDYVIKEYQDEIYGISKSASPQFEWIGTNYSRQLNYHAAHDIGHALANMMLVGCSSFATWGSRSVDSQLIVGRNFDFYVGDEFAKNKIIAFYRPKQGIPFMSVTWGGFTGVVSGMNAEGLTVTINAAKSDIPFGAATPVSLVAREILQYASTIDEAYAIAKKRKMFVSESFLISSAKDNRAVVIEKTPKEIGMYEGNGESILCTNHYQSEQLKNQELNQEQIKNSASLYRYTRLTELLNRTSSNSVQNTANILRDYKGIQDADIGLTNEKAMNQFIAHHSIIFEPSKKLVWVSTSPWQLGAYLCYDLNQIFSDSKCKIPNYISSNTIAPDSLLQTATYTNLTQYLSMEKKALRHEYVSPSALVSVNPTYYDTYRIAGDLYNTSSKKDSAIIMYTKALTLEIATEEERHSIEKKLQQLKQD